MHEKQLVLHKKRQIQESFWKNLGFRVSMSKCGGFGGSNNSNVARIAFQIHAVFSKITRIDVEIIPLDLDKFEKILL